jgi:hypothetical protein
MEDDNLELANFKTTIALRVSYPELQRILEFKKRYKISSRSDAIVELVKLGLFVEGKIGLAETWNSKDIEEIREQLEMGQLVDFMAQMSLDKFSAIANIVRTEYEARYKRKLTKE